MTIKHIIRREATKPQTHRFTERMQGRPDVTIPTPDAIRLRTALPERTRESVHARRAENFLRGGGGAMLQLLMDLYDGQPVDLQFGDKIIHFEVRDTVDEPPEEAPAPPRGRTNAD